MSEFRFPDPQEREKRARLIEMLEVGKVMVYVNPARPGVDLPPHLQGQIAVPLNLSRRFQLETFEIGPLSVKASLSFGGERYLCVVPYGAVFGLYGHEDGTRLVFADAVPAEVAIVEPAEGAREQPAETAPEASAETGQPDESPTAEQRARPALRLVDE